MEHETLLKAMQHQYPAELATMQIILGFEPAFEAVEDKKNKQVKHVPTGIPENSPNHARIVTWPAHLPAPTVGDIEQWAAAYDAAAPERDAQETAKAQKRQADTELIDSFDETKNYTLAELKVVVAALIRRNKER